MEIEEQNAVDIFMENRAGEERPARITSFGPLYYEAHNLAAAEDTNTTYLHPGGDSNLNLEGEGFEIGVFDAGHVLDTHVEFQNGNNRVVVGYDVGFEINYNWHGTHVGGTIGASGVRGEAKGMAPKCRILSYDWSWVNQEILSGNFGDAYLSNHSYGLRGWNSNGNVINAAYLGTYDNWASNTDEVHYARPKYLGVYSAGNDGRNNNPEPIYAGYDKLTDNSTAKNNLVVANARDIWNYSGGQLIQINAGSSQGPTNDLRIKPDIAGNGTSLLSTYTGSDTAYATASGTSMASPNVAGSLILLQEYYFKTTGEIPLSSTIKALVFNGAKDAGDVGPDPIFGWGFLDMKKSSQIIGENVSNKTIVESSILNGEEIEYSLEVNEGIENISVTICWTDPSANSLENAEDKDASVLVNDLDMRIVEISDGEVIHLPYTLSLENLNINGVWAVKADNSKDNVERIDFMATQGAVYKILINHKNSIENPTVDNDELKFQNFSIVVSEGSRINTTLSNDNVFDLNDNAFHYYADRSSLNLTNHNNYSIDKLEIYGITGKLLYSKSNIGNINSYEVYEIPKFGILSIDYNNKKFIRKFVKK